MYTEPEAGAAEGSLTGSSQRRVSSVNTRGLDERTNSLDDSQIMNNFGLPIIVVLTKVNNTLSG